MSNSTEIELKSVDATSAPNKQLGDVDSSVRLDAMIERWRFDAIRGGAIVAMQIASDLLRHAEEGGWLDNAEQYHKTMELVAVLAKSLHEGTAVDWGGVISATGY